MFAKKRKQPGLIATLRFWWCAPVRPFTAVTKVLTIHITSLTPLRSHNLAGDLAVYSKRSSASILEDEALNNFYKTISGSKKKQQNVILVSHAQTYCGALASELVQFIQQLLFDEDEKSRLWQNLRVHNHNHPVTNAGSGQNVRPVFFSKFYVSDVEVRFMGPRHKTSFTCWDGCPSLMTAKWFPCVSQCRAGLVILALVKSHHSRFTK